MEADAVHIGGIVVQTLIFLAGIYGMVIRTDAVSKDLRKEMEAMEEQLKELSRVVTKQAVQDERLLEQSRRMTMLEQRVEDLRRGRGYVQDRDVNVPIDREY